MEHQPKVKLLARIDNDRAVLQAAKNIVQRVTDALNINPGQPFEVLNLNNRPKCHYQPMVLAGEPGSRVWRCEQCGETQSVEVVI